MRRHRFVLLAGGALLLLCACVGLVGGASFFFGSWRPCGQGNGTSSGDITIFSGQTADHITACGGNVAVLGHITGDVTAYGGSVTISASGIVDGNITSYGGRVEVAGLVQGDVTSYGASVTLDSLSHVQGNVQTYGGGISKMTDARVDGSIDRNHPTSFSLTNLPFLNPFGFSFPGVSIIVWVLIAAALAHWFPQRTLRVGEVMFSNLPRSLAIGALSWVLGGILAVILALTIIGIPVTLAILLVLAAGGVLGNVAIGWLIGRGILQRLARRDYSPVLEAMVGVAILALIESLPFLGFLLSIFIALLGVGATLLSRFGSSRWRVSSFRRRAV
ncbi:MAG TPA: polymer-forming cytoskeletal protein [Ktedonobacterales bacterium]|nr:polymer-forming cytoskeletal protein [Ktedonobacterales bacterium]